MLGGKLFTIVGSRKSLPPSKNIAVNYTKELSGAGYALVTGIAEGVDEAVLETALSVGGKAISVIAGGFDNIYPSSHKSLAERIAENGLLISEYPPEVKAMPYFFPLRNRILAALSKGTLVVSASKKSGTIITAEYAEEYGKDLFCVPYSVGIESGVGCNDLIKRGAMLTDSPDDLLDFYGEEKKEKVFLTSEEKEVTDVLRNGELHIEKMCEALGKQIFEVMPILAVLEIKGVIVKNGNNVYGLLRI